MSGSLWIAHRCAGGGLLWSLSSLLLLLLSLSGIAKTLSVEDLAIFIAMVENALISSSTVISFVELTIGDVPLSTLGPF